MTDLMEQLESALEKGQQARRHEPRAISAYFDAPRNRVVIALANEATFEFPPELAQGLAGATAEQLADIEILDDGSALHWELLDADFSVAQLLSGVFGTAKWMAARAGSSKSARKGAAARENGTKGGRPSRAELRSRNDAIAEIVGREPLPRAEIVGRLWDHIRKNNLQNPENKREILADSKLKAVFGKDRITMNEMGKKLSSIQGSADSEKEPKARKAASKHFGNVRSARRPGSKRSA